LKDFLPIKEAAAENSKMAGRGSILLSLRQPLFAERFSLPVQRALFSQGKNL
jgi:hypothetical protein